MTNKTRACFIKILKEHFTKYFNELKIAGKNKEEIKEFKKIIDKSSLLTLINYLTSSKTTFENIKSFLKYMKQLMVEENDKSGETLKP